VSKPKPKPKVDPTMERVYRRGYCAGWAAATKKLAKMLSERGLSGKDAAAVLEAHKADVLARLKGGAE
jgi:hypothetical protein